MGEDLRRVFFGFSVEAPWPGRFPRGRIMRKKDRHITSVFLGESDYDALKKEMESLAVPSFALSPIGYFDKCLFLPDKRCPNVVAWHPRFLTFKEQIEDFVKSVKGALSDRGFYKPKEKRAWLPHVTLGRRPFFPRDWSAAFSPLPFQITGYSLYQSLGNSTFEMLWSYKLPAAFTSIDRRAGSAYHIFGEHLYNLYLHAKAALCFSFPELVPYIAKHGAKPLSFHEMIEALNEWITEVDIKGGPPIKGVSYHGEIKADEKGLLHWEMVIEEKGPCLH